MATRLSDPSALLGAVPFLVVDGGEVVEVGDAVDDELGCDAKELLGPLDAIGTRLDDAGFDELCRGQCSLRVRLGAELGDVPVRLRRLGVVDDRTWIEVRSLADEFRLVSLLRRSGTGHMLLSPRIELLWSMSSNDLSEVFPGDDPTAWIDLMDPDDMHELGSAIHAVGNDPALRRVVRHRLRADRTHTIIDVVESAVHDPDLRGVLVRSRLEDTAIAELEKSTASFAGQTVSDHMPIGVVVATDAGVVLHRNAVASELLGARLGLAVLPVDGAPWMLTALPPDQVEQYELAYRSACAGVAASCTIASPTVDRHWLRVSISPSSAKMVVITAEDATDLVEAERAVRASNRLLEALDSHSEELVIVLDEGGRSRYTSSSVRRRLGASAVIDDVRDLIEIVSLADRSALDELIGQTTGAPGSSGAVDLRIDVAGASRWHHATVTNLLDDPDVAGTVITLRDVHERHLMEGELRFRAMHDPLTTLPDRATLQERLAEVLAADSLADALTALLFCDVDHFKDVNDRYGHHVGDRVLTGVADRLRSAVRSTDVVARFGGDEFVVVMPGVTDADHARALARQVFESARGRVEIDELGVDVSLSAGLAVSEAGGTSAEHLIRRADLAMYESKRRGRDRLSVHGEADGR